MKMLKFIIHLPHFIRTSGPLVAVIMRLCDSKTKPAETNDGFCKARIMLRIKIWNSNKLVSTA